MTRQSVLRQFQFHFHFRLTETIESNIFFDCFSLHMDLLVSIMLTSFIMCMSLSQKWFWNVVVVSKIEMLFYRLWEKIFFLTRVSERENIFRSISDIVCIVQWIYPTVSRQGKWRERIVVLWHFKLVFMQHRQSITSITMHAENGYGKCI